MAVRASKVVLRVLLLVTLGLLVLVGPWRWLAPPTTAFIAQYRLAGGSTVPRSWIPLQEMGPWLPIAVVSAEDQKFPLHHGFDFDSISRALTEERAVTRGASTISQQLAKNLYLWPGRSLVRKALEAALTLVIEALWPKRRILEVYLNVVEFGQGVYGAGAASREFFRRHPRDLTPAQAALLAAVLPNPKRLSARNPGDYVLRRARAIQRGVHNLGGPAYLPWLEKP